MAVVRWLLCLFVPFFPIHNQCTMTDRPEDQRPTKLPRSSCTTTDTTSRTSAESTTTTLKFVEFYCGVGGWSMALEAAIQSISKEDDNNNIKLQCVAALDHSDLCTKVYRHNHPQHAQPSTTKNIEKLTPKQLQTWQADIWAMSPPCQPHTRQHSRQSADLDDPRSASFLHLCELLDTLPHKSLPRLVLVENVVGFESSHSCRRLRQVLARRRYQVGHFHVSPTQVGIPNDRPRYYCVAVRSKDKISSKDPLQDYVQLEAASDDDDDSLLEDCKIQTHVEDLKILAPDNEAPLPTLGSFLNADNHQDLDLRIPPKVLNSNAAWCFDIVTPDDRRSACFTSAYGKFVRGTGSVLYFGGITSTTPATFELVPPNQREYNPDWSKGLDLAHNLRYLSGSELARLLDLKEGFAFPDDVTLKQQWKLMGNSLNVRVAARLSELGLRLIL